MHFLFLFGRISNYLTCMIIAENIPTCHCVILKVYHLILKDIHAADQGSLCQ